MWKLFLQIVGCIAGIFLAERFISGVNFSGTWQNLLWIGVILGLLNYFIKPILKLLTLPLRILTLGLFGLVINILIVWAVDQFFQEISFEGIIPLFWTSIIIWGISFFLIKWMPGKALGERK